MSDLNTSTRSRWTGWLMIVVGCALAAGFIAVAVIISRQAVDTKPVKLAAVPVLLSSVLIAIGVVLVLRAREGDA